MALDTFTNLKTSVEAWLNRSDMTTQVPEFITLAEVKIAQRVRRKVVRATLTVNAAQVTVPTTISELRTIHLVTGSAYRDVPLDVVPLEDVLVVRARHAGATGRPTHAAVVGTEIHFAPTPDDSYTAEYVGYEKLAPLGAAQATNSVLTEAPDVYLYGALAEAEAFLEHDERIATWQAKFDAAVEALNGARRREEFNASKRKSRLPVVFG